MRRFFKLPAWLWIALVLDLGAETLVADTPGNPYLGITDRNVFRLKQPESPVIRPPVLQLPRIKLMGITTFGGKLALLKIYLPARPPETASEFSCILALGQRRGVIQVLEVDELAGSVKVDNSGTEMLLTLETDRAGPQNPALPPRLPLPIRAAAQ